MLESLSNSTYDSSRFFEQNKSIYPKHCKVMVLTPLPHIQHDISTEQTYEIRYTTLIWLLLLIKHLYSRVVCGQVWLQERIPRRHVFGKNLDYVLIRVNVNINEITYTTTPWAHQGSLCSMNKTFIPASKSIEKWYDIGLLFWMILDTLNSVVSHHWQPRCTWCNKVW